LTFLQIYAVSELANRFQKDVDKIASDGHAYQVDLQPPDIIEAESRSGLCFQPVLDHDHLLHNSSKAGFGRSILCKSCSSSDLVHPHFFNM
jgi:hypothetical protein